jgi:hypothetical protein
MKRTFMIGVAAGALLAGVNIAAAQGTMEKQQPGASEQQQKSGSGAQQQQKGSGGAQMKSDSPATSGQAPQKQDAQKQDAQKQGDQKQDAQKQGDQQKGAQKPDQKQDAQKQGDQKQDAQKQDAQKQDAKSGQAAGGGKTLSTEQRTKIRQTVISSGPKVTNVNFSVSVGTVIPRTVTLAPLHPILVEIYPEWRSYRYVIVEERIIIVDENFRIVAVLVV